MNRLKSLTVQPQDMQLYDKKAEEIKSNKFFDHLVSDKLNKKQLIN